MRRVLIGSVWSAVYAGRMAHNASLPAALMALTMLVTGCADAPTASPVADGALASVTAHDVSLSVESTGYTDDEDDDSHRLSTRRPSLARDLQGDFLATYVGRRARDVDARRQEVRVRGDTFIFRARVDGRIGRTAGALYVWGVDRGAGTARFSSIGVTGVLFDWVLVVDLANGSSARDLITGVVTPIPTSAITVRDNRLAVRVPASALPSQGVATEAYTSNFWPRVGLGNNNQIADFAPDNANVPVLIVR